MLKPVRAVGNALADAQLLVRSGVLAPTHPHRLIGMGAAVARWRLSPATGYAAGAARHPHRVALIDDLGSLTYREIDARSGRIAAELTRLGVRSGDAVGLLARNGRGFAEAAAALSRCGADVLYLGTGTATGQLQEVLAREGARFVVHDEELEPPTEGVTTEQLDLVAATPGPAGPRWTGRAPRQVILTSGTTGPPRGAARGTAGAEGAISALDRMPVRARETTVLAAPAFHAWGLGHWALGMAMGSTLVMHRKFDPEQVLRSVQEHRATVLVVVPVMLEQLLAADPSRFDLSSLRMIASSGSALPGDLVERSQAAFGPVLHSLYGSTEVAYAAIATPADLARDPRTAGRPPRGVRLKILDDSGRELPDGEVGRIFVGSGLAFSGYTDGTDKDRRDGMIATGDLGRIDATGCLAVLGRDDDMVVIGGENVFTGQVEHALLTHPAVVDAAVVDVPDERWGSRLVAHVVLTQDISDGQLQDVVRERLAKGAVPREVVRHDALPRNATGKVQKRELRP